jgi:hypothetical protein
LKLSAVALTIFGALILLATPATARAQNAPESTARWILHQPPPRGPEGSWLYTVTIPGYTFQGIETYSTDGGYTEADQLSFSPLAVASARRPWRMEYDNRTDIRPHLP